MLTEVSDLEGHVSLEAIGCGLPLAEIYAKVQFLEGVNPLRPWSAAS